MNNPDIFFDNLPLFIPLIILELVLDIVALVHIFKHQKYRFGNRILWIILVLLFQPIGAVVYLLVGKENE
mgnify:FL=1|jgi:hypothetical protein